MMRHKLVLCVILFFLIAADLYSQSAVDYNKKGTDYFNQGEYTLAEHYFKLAIKVDPKFKEAHQNLGVLKFKQKEFLEAYQSFKIALYYLPCDQAIIKDLKEVVDIIIDILRSNLKKSTESLGDSGNIVSLPDPHLTEFIIKVNANIQNLNTCFVCNGTGIIICNCEKSDSQGHCPQCQDKKIYKCPICDGTGEWCPR
jgi:tetratricopeptide (TPR) repeat protein